jgi:hypothetical protein
VKAIELGLLVDRVSEEPLLASCRDAPQVKAALSAPRKPQSAAPVIHLVAPPLPESGSLGAPADR